MMKGVLRVLGILASFAAVALGLLGLWLGLGAWRDMATSPDWAAFRSVSERYEQAILREFETDGDVNCERVVDLIAFGHLLNIPGFMRGTDAANEDERCGRWPSPDSGLNWTEAADFYDRDIRVSTGAQITVRRAGWRLNTVFSPDPGIRAFYAKLLAGNRVCEPEAVWSGRLLNFRTRAAEEVLKGRSDLGFPRRSHLELEMERRRLSDACDDYLVARWAEDLLMPGPETDSQSRARAIAWLHLHWAHNADAIWLHWTGQPRTTGGRYVPPPGLSDEERRAYSLSTLRYAAGLGHEEAALVMLSEGADRAGLPVRGARRNGEFEYTTYPWAGGYATPFWMAVHAQRFSLPYVEQRRAAYEAEIGEACTALARRIGAMLPALYAQLPEDRPEVRDLILSSLACQPEGLREAAAYPGGGYWPPEIDRVAPDFTPHMIPEGWVWREGDD
jgi:hypothetical protein